MTATGRAMALLLALWAAWALAACGGDGGEEETTTLTIPDGEAQTLPPEDAADAVEQAGGSDQAAEAEQAAERYVRAIDARDAAGVCAALAPEALQGVRGVSGACEEALSSALGRAPAGGAPVWKRTEIQGPTKIATAAERARVTLEVLHRFADRRYPSLEDDVIYLERRDGRWLVVKASATLYRALGYPEPPLRAFTAPTGWPPG